MTQAHLLEGKNCPKCSGKHRYNTEEFIAECKSRYGESFDYSNTIYTTAHSYISVKCNTCNLEINRDLNASINIHRVGASTLRGETVRLASAS